MLFEGFFGFEAFEVGDQLAFHRSLIFESRRMKQGGFVFNI